ncbi:peptidoglycan editing factor PgeF [Roseibium sediminis]|uniref:peptidoglycan editing factor PgeF n=1 Tax=Roseibium sediminis TaxID=1775174 RepID=UPI00123CBB98|nr:peptidoglycan editing factor PgeF [Roseibium sediminis]
MIKADALEKPGIVHGFFTRQGGVSDGIYASRNVGLGSNDDRDKVLENRKRIANALGTEADRLATPYQIHSADVITLAEPFSENDDRKADALVTNQKGLAIGILTADCGPVLFADAEAGVVGAAHAGWKGAIGGILQNTISAMEALGARRGRISAILGPTISQAAYEVGPEFHERFLDANSGYTRFFNVSEKPDHYMFNLPAFIRLQLETAGVSIAGDIGLCTYCDEERFFSYRRTTHRNEPDYGRQISAIMIKEA